MSEFLKEMIAAVEKIRRDYPDVPVRFEFAPDIYEALREAVPAGEAVANLLTGAFYPGGVPCVVVPGRGMGEWAPVFRCSPPIPLGALR